MRAVVCSVAIQCVLDHSIVAAGDHRGGLAALYEVLGDEIAMASDVDCLPVVVGETGCVVEVSTAHDISTALDLDGTNGMLPNLDVVTADSPDEHSRRTSLDDTVRDLRLSPFDHRRRGFGPQNAAVNSMFGHVDSDRSNDRER